MRRIVGLVLLLVPLLFVNACNNDDSATPTPATGDGESASKPTEDPKLPATGTESPLLPGVPPTVAPPDAPPPSTDGPPPGTESPLQTTGSSSGSDTGTGGTSSGLGSGIGSSSSGGPGDAGDGGDIPLPPPDVVDSDGDGIPDATDHCVTVADPLQIDLDADGQGDACDDDTDNDGVANANDNCPLVANADQLDGNADGTGNACTADSDGDSIADSTDNCPNVANPNQGDTDNDKLGNPCDFDDDADGISDAHDNCLVVANANQLDLDGNAVGDLCDPGIVWMSPSGGVKGNGGTLAHPFSAFQLADALKAAGLKDKKVFFLAGEYAFSSFALPNGIALYGSLQHTVTQMATTLEWDRKQHPTHITGAIETTPFLDVQAGSRTSVMHGMEFSLTQKPLDAGILMTRGVRLGGNVTISQSSFDVSSTLTQNLCALCIDPSQSSTIVVRTSKIAASKPKGTLGATIAIGGFLAAATPKINVTLTLEDNHIEANDAASTNGVILQTANGDPLASQVVLRHNEIECLETTSSARCVILKGGADALLGSVVLERNGIVAGSDDDATAVQLQFVNDLRAATNGIGAMSMQGSGDVAALQVDDSPQVRLYSNTLRAEKGGAIVGLAMKLTPGQTAQVINNIISVVGGTQATSGLKVGSVSTSVHVARNLLFASGASAHAYFNSEDGAVAEADAQLAGWAIVADAAWPSLYNMDPQYESEMPFRLKATSPAINKGYDLGKLQSEAGTVRLNVDLLGNRRTAPVDIGAVELLQ